MLVSSQINIESAEKYIKEQQYNKANSVLESLLKQNPNDLKAIEYLGDIQCHYKNWEKAIPYYKKLTELNPKKADYFYKYGGVLGMYAKECNNFKALFMMKEVKASFEKAIYLNPKHIDARWALIEVYIQLPEIVGGSQLNALKYSDELFKISPIDGYLSKGHIFEFYKKYNLAEQQYLKAISIGNSKTSYQKLADLYKYKMNLPEKAKQTLQIYNEKNKT
jgi:tetratricopeptide (TPR) repeat protein